MIINPFALLAYGLFLLVALIVNLLYIFQVFKYRLPGDASLSVLTLHIILVLTVIFTSSFYLFSH